LGETSTVASAPDMLYCVDDETCFVPVSIRMGGGQSSPSPPPPPRVTLDPYPTQERVTNLSLASGITAGCTQCDMSIDSRATTSSVILKRDFGNISDLECLRYQKDLDAVRANEMSFRDFIANLQAGQYSRPVSSNNKGQTFCAQVKLPYDTEKEVEEVDLYSASAGGARWVDSFDFHMAPKLRTIRIRQVTGGGSFSSGTKARFTLSLPLKISYTERLEDRPKTVTIWTPQRGWVTFNIPGPSPVAAGITVSTLSLYHPSPLRIENVQHDAVLSLNDPSDPTATAIILIPLKSSNNEEASVGFFSKLGYYLSRIETPDPVSDLYPETTISTGNDWGINKVFRLGTQDETTKMSPINDAFFTWSAAPAYKQVELSRTSAEIRMGWVASGLPVRYFMLQEPVAISSTDLSFLTRSLPPTPAEDAIHVIPVPAAGKTPKVLYNSGSCEEDVVERMTNPTLETQGSDLLDDSCDPFATNAKRVTSNPTPFTANRALGLLFAVAMAIAVAFGAWAGLYFVTNKDYDFKFRGFSEDVGLIAGDYMVKLAEKVQQGVSAAKGAFSAVSSIGSMMKKGPAGVAKGAMGSSGIGGLVQGATGSGGLGGLVKGATGAAGDAASTAATGAVGKVPGLGALTSLIPKA